MPPLRFIHFADAHIDMENTGKRDSITGLAFRVLDFLKSLDTIVDTAIAEKVDFVLFAGDAYRDRAPLPTHQREWGRRIMRLSQAKIPTLLLVGNHDISPVVNRASTLHEFDTLNVPFVKVIHKPELLTPDQLWDLPLQAIAIPWISEANVRNAMRNRGEDNDKNPLDTIGENLNNLLDNWFKQLDPTLPTILLAHASVEGASYGAERMVMLGKDFTLAPGLVKDTRLDYTALGHIHKMQNLNLGSHPPVVYPGSIERVDYGESADEKYFVLGEIQKGKTDLNFRKLSGVRPIYRCSVTLKNDSDVLAQVMAILPPKQKIKDAMISLSITYPREMEAQIDINAIREYTAEAFDFRYHLRPTQETRSRLGADQNVSSYPPVDLLGLYLREVKTDPDESVKLIELAKSIFDEQDDLPTETES